jgi:hypothetical protein
MGPAELGDLLAHGAASGPAAMPGPSRSDPKRPGGRSGRRGTEIPAS